MRFDHLSSCLTVEASSLEIQTVLVNHLMYSQKHSCCPSLPCNVKLAIMLSLLRKQRKECSQSCQNIYIAPKKLEDANLEAGGMLGERNKL